MLLVTNTLINNVRTFAAEKQTWFYVSLTNENV